MKKGIVKIFTNKLFYIFLAILVALLGAIILFTSNEKRELSNLVLTKELLVAMEYEQFEEKDKKIDETDNVEFSAFFLRDLDGDGYTEKIKGTCRPLGQEDTLYMELNVLNEGYLKDAKLKFINNNFCFQTVLPKDAEFKNSYISNNTQIIEFNDINSGTQKLIQGKVRSGDYSYSNVSVSAIGNNINNYSKDDNKIVLTGIYVDDNGNEKEIEKEVNLEVDWYGTTKASTESIYKYQNYTDLPSRIDEEKQILTVDFRVYNDELNRLLNLKKNYVEIDIPTLSEIEPLNVEVINVNDNVNVVYDKETRKLVIENNASVDENGIITYKVYDSNIYNIKVTYPLEAYYAIGDERIELKVPFLCYYEGFNNPNDEFDNPFKSNVVSDEVRLTITNPIEVENISHPYTHFDVTIGKYEYNPINDLVISKRKPLRIYGGLSEKEVDDTYLVRWDVRVYKNSDETGIIMKENSSDEFIKSDNTVEKMDNVTKNVGIYFSGFNNLLNDDGFIKIYDDETDNLIATFTKDDWNKYSASNPYRYENPVKHIRIETSNIKETAYASVNNIKELDDEYITSHYTREEFDNLKYIKTQLKGIKNGVEYNAVEKALYQAPYAYTKIETNKSVLSTQATEYNNLIKIYTNYNSSYNQALWYNSTFLVQFPKEVLTVDINDIKINDKNVEIISYETIKTQEGVAIKIITNNKNDGSNGYVIDLDLNITPDPRTGNCAKDIKLFATTEEECEYLNEVQDIYDIDGDSDVLENITQSSVEIEMIAPNSLLTNQSASEFDENNSVAISPEVVELKPDYNSDKGNVAKIGVHIRNNYSSTISETLILGKIPFEGNTYVFNEKELNSEFSAKMMNTGIEVPEELKSKVDVYYSENENPTKDILLDSNGWTKDVENINWENVKTYLIDFKNTIIEPGIEYTFYYGIQIENNLEFNLKTYSHHGVYFSLDTEEGRYQTKTEPNKLGFMITDKFNLNVSKYHKNKDNLVPGAMYSITEINSDGTKGDTKTAVTNSEGYFNINDLLVGKKYEIKEIKSPKNYAINTDTVEFVALMDKEGKLTVEIQKGDIRDEVIVEQDENSNNAYIKLEDEAKAKVKILKTEKGTNNVLSFVKFKIKGEGLPASGKIITTDVNGICSLNGLSVNKEYIIEEVKADGYYLNAPIKFKILNENGEYRLDVIEGEAKAATLIEEEFLPTASFEIENNKKSLVSIEVNKIKNIINTEIIANDSLNGDEEVVYLPGAKFKLYKNNIEIGTYITDENGKFVINDLYEFVEGKNEDAIYNLKEIVPPQGYSKAKDITFKVQNVDGTLKFINMNGTENKYVVSDSTVKLIIEDNPSFKLIKKDKETGEVLAGVKFAIYNIDDEEVPARNSKGEILGTLENINGIEYYILTTDANGSIVVDLPEGLYKAVEVETLDKYDIKVSDYYFGVGSNKEGLPYYKPENIIELQVDATNIIDTIDGNYIIVGDLTNIELNDGTSINSAGFAKCNSKGEFEFKKALKGIQKLRETADGGYIIYGNFSQDDILRESGVEESNLNGLIKFDIDGQFQWFRPLDLGYRRVSNLILTNDEGYFLTSYTTGGPGSDHPMPNVGNVYGDAYWEKYNKDGVLEHQGGTSGYYIERISNIIVNDDGSFYMIINTASPTTTLECGASFSNSSRKLHEDYFDDRENDPILVKYNNQYEYEWGFDISGYGDEYIYNVFETEDGGIIISGYFYSCSATFNNGISIGNENCPYDCTYEYWHPGDSYTAWYDSNGNCQRADNSYYYIPNIQKENGNYLKVGDTYIEEVDKNLNNVMTTNFNFDICNAKLLDNDKLELIVTTDEVVKIDEDTTIGVDGETKFYILTYCVSSKDGIKSSNLLSYIDKGWGDRATGDGVQFKDGSYAIAVGYNAYDVTINGQEIVNNSDNTDGGKETDILLVKYNKEKEIEWAKGIGGRYSDNVDELIATENGNFILDMKIGSYEERISDIILDENTTYEIQNDDSTNLLIEYDKDGNILNITEEARNNYNYYYDSNRIVIDDTIVAAETYYDDYDKVLIRRYRKSNNDYKDDYYNEENLIWEKIINKNAPYEEELKFIKKTPDNNILVVIETQNSFVEFENGDILTISKDKCDYNTVFIMFDLNGNILGYDVMEGRIRRDSNPEVVFENNQCFIDIERTYSNSYWGDDFEKVRIILDENGCIVKLKEYTGLIDIVRTSDDGYVAWGNFDNTDLGNDIIANNTSFIKYNKNDEVEWVYEFENSFSDCGFIKEIGNNKFIIATYQYQSDRTEYGKYNTNICLIEELKNIVSCQELVVENERKELKIETKVKKILGKKGGTISGENTVYETVLYGDSSTKEIIVTPDDGYDIKEIKINNKAIEFIPNEDGTYVIPLMENVIEDIIVEASFVLEENKLIINKIDGDTEEPISGVTFELQQIDERELPEDSIKELVKNGDTYTWLNEDINITDDVVGELTSNGEVYDGIVDKSKDYKEEVFGKLVGNSEDKGYGVDKTIELVDVVGDMVNNGTYYFVKQDDSYIPTNSKKYQETIGGTSGIQSSTANSYVEIDLTGYEGEYSLVVNAKVSSESCDYGFAFVTEDTNAPYYDDSAGRFIYIGGTSSTVNTNKDYNSTALEGGKKYYLHLGYYKDGSVDSGEDVFTVNSINVYGISEMTVDFIENNGTYESTNIGMPGTISSSYIPIDLTDYEGEYVAVINAGVSSYYNDYGYVHITESIDRPLHTSTDGRIIHISGNYYYNQISFNDYKSMTLEGGKKYYLHMGYSKDDYSSKYGQDKFVINSINVYKLESKSFNFVEVDGRFESNNVGEHNTTASSYIPIDLTNYEGEYRVSINAAISSEYNADYGRAYVTETTDRPNIDTDEPFVELDGYPEDDMTGTGMADLDDYPSQTLEGGKKYYLHLMYSKDNNYSNMHDKFVINSVGVYGIILEKYDFIEKDGRYESTNQGREKSTSTSYIPIDLTNYEGKYNIIVNANLSSEKGNGAGYVALTETTDKPDMYNDSFIYISGKYDENTVIPTDYTTVAEGGKKYYLHMGYYKWKPYYWEDEEDTEVVVDDKFYINSVKIALNGSDLYNTKVTTNGLGKVMINVPFGKYSVKEISVPEEYELNENATIFEFRDNINNEYTVRNKKVAKVIVHHYKAIDKGNGEYEYTDEKIAEDTILSDKAGYEYTTMPELDNDQYELIKDINGEYILPENAKGQYKSGEQEVSYYYVQKQSSVIVNHYIIGTENEVELQDGSKATQTVQNGTTGESYVTNAVGSELSEKYELVSIPENATGQFNNSQIIVNYYYDIKKFNVKTSVEKHIEVDDLGKVTYVEGGTISGQEQNIYEQIKYGESSTKEIIVIPDEGYKVSKIRVNGEPIIFDLDEDGKVTLDNFVEVKEDKDIQVEFTKETGKVIIQHRLDETLEPVEAIEEGEFVPDKIKEGSIGSRFMTKPSEEVSPKYAMVNSSEYTSGIYKEEEQTVTYYYDVKEFNYKIEYYYDGILDSTKTEERKDIWGTNIDSYDDKVEDGYIFDRTENFPLTISEIEDNNVIKVYYELEESEIIVKYVDKETDEEIAEPKTVTGRRTETHDLNEDIIEIECYTFKEFESGNNVEFEKDTKEVIIYYAANTKVIVNYIDMQNNIVLETQEILGKVGDEYVIAAKDFENYILESKPENENGIMTREEIIINYYYKYISEGVVEKHIDIKTNNLLDSKQHNGTEGDSYLTESKEFEGYDVVTNEQYYKEFINEQYTEEEIQELLTKYNVSTKEELFEQHMDELVLEIINQNGLSSKDQYIPENKDGIMEKELIEVKYYYIKQTKVKVEYVNKQTGEIIKYEEKTDDNDVEIKEAIEVINGHEGDLYTTNIKEFEGYEIIKDEEGNDIIPSNASGKMTAEDIVVRYEYLEKAKVIEKHIDIKTNEIIEEIVHNGYVNDEYKIDAKTYDNYVIVKDKLPNNSEGNMTKEDIVVEYYYAHTAKVIVEYIDKYSGNKLKDIVYVDTDFDGKVDKVEYEDSTEVIDGFVGDEYETIIKEFDNYKLVEDKLPENSKGKMTEEDINVKYYYVKKSAGVLEEHKDLYSKELIEESKMHYGYEGDEYSTSRKEFTNYNFREDMLPENANGTMTKDLITVTYYYVRKTEVIVKYVDEKTGKEIAEEVIIPGREGDSYTTTEKEIDGYDFVKESENKEGTMTGNTIEVTYYYAKKAVNPPQESPVEQKPNEEAKPNGEQKPNPEKETIIEHIVIVDSSDNNANNATNKETTNNVIKNDNNGKNEETKTPDTGDKTPIIIIVALMLIVLINLIYFLKKDKKDNKDEQTESLKQKR